MGVGLPLRLAAADKRIDAVATIVSSGESLVLHPTQHAQSDNSKATKLLLGKPMSNPKVLSQIFTVPVFLNVGANDRFFWLTGADRFLKQIPNDNTSWLIRANSDHLAGGLFIKIRFQYFYALYSRLD